MIGLVCAFFLYIDLKSFIDKRNPNLYNIVGINRMSEPDFISERLDLAKNCDIESTEEAC